MDKQKWQRQTALINSRRDVVKVVIIYVLGASLWIWGSDRLLVLLVPEMETFRELELYKGWIFVFVTAGLLLWMLTQFVETLKGWEETLERSRDHMREIFDSMGTAIAMTDLRGRYTYTNPAYRELFGYSAGELLGEHVSITGLGGEEPASTPTGTVEYVVDQGESWRGEALRVDKRGRVVPVYLTVSPMYDQSGKAYGLLADMVDLRSVKEWPPHLGGFALALQRLGRKSSFGQLGEAAVNEAVAVAGAELGMLALIDEQRNVMECRWAVGYEEAEVPSQVSLNQGLWGRALAQRRTLWIDEAAEAETGLALMPEEEVEAVAIVPLIVGDEPVGVLMVATRQRSHAFGDHQINMLEAIAETAAAGYEREQSIRGYVPFDDEGEGSSERPSAK